MSKKTATYLLYVIGILAAAASLAAYLAAHRGLSGTAADVLVFVLAAALAALIVLLILTIVRDKQAESAAEGRTIRFPEPNLTEPVPSVPYTPPVKKRYLVCRGGYMDGKKIPLRSSLRIGRSSDNDLIYPNDYPVISKRHAAVTTRDGKTFLTDSSSTQTFLKKGSNGMSNADVIPKETPIELRPGDVFYLGTKENRFELVEE